jgi:hypothetical protein
MARNTKQLIAALKRESKRLAKVRDELREIEERSAELAQSADDALDSLSYAVDRLSELV